MTTKSLGYKWQLLSIVMIGTMMSALDSSIVNISIPPIMADFGVSLDEIEWVITSYMLAFASLMPLTAWLRDQIGHKKLYVGSLFVFTLGSLLCGVSWNLPTMIFARVIQAVGGGALTPTGMAMISEVFEPHERGKALGFWGMGAVMGPAFGPTVGGYLTKMFGWPSIFMINLPIGIIGIYLAVKVLRADDPKVSEKPPFDAAGFIFLAVFLISFLMAMSKGEVEGWGSRYVITCYIFAVVGLTGFLTVESLVKNRIMNIELLKNPVFAACFGLTGMRSLALYGGTFMLPVFLQNFKGLDELQSGILMAPGAFIVAMMMPIGGKLGDIVSPRILAFFGFLFMGLFFYQYRMIDIQTSNWGIVWPTLVRGVGLAILMAPLSATALNSLPNRQAGMGASMLNIIQQVGGSMGIAFLGLALHRRTAMHLNHVGSTLSSQSPEYIETLTKLIYRAKELGLSSSDSHVAAGSVLGGHIVKAVGVLAFQDTFLIASFLTFAAGSFFFLLPNEPAKRRSPGATHME